MAVGESAGDGESVEDVALSEGVGATVGDVTDGDDELSTGDGLLPDGEGAPAVWAITGWRRSTCWCGASRCRTDSIRYRRTSALSTSVVVLHVVQLVHAFWLVAIECSSCACYTGAVRGSCAIGSYFLTCTQFVQSVQ